MNNIDVLELSKMITAKVLSKIVIKLEEIEKENEDEIDYWDYDADNMVVFGEFKNGGEFEEEIV